VKLDGEFELENISLEKIRSITGGSSSARISFWLVSEI
jgi:hypothetical protein